MSKKKKKMFIVKLHSFIDENEVWFYQATIIRLTCSHPKVSYISNPAKYSDHAALEIFGLQKVLPEVPNGFHLHIETVNNEVYKILTEYSVLDAAKNEGSIIRMINDVKKAMSKKYKWKIVMGNVSDPLMQNKPLTFDRIARKEAQTSLAFTINSGIDI